MKANKKSATTSRSQGVREQLSPLMFEVGRLLKSEIYRDGISLPSYLHIETLRFIQSMQKEGKAPAMTDIADYLKVARPSATTLVNAFVKDGIIQRVADPEDRRLVRLALSSKGKRLLDQAMEKRAQAFARVTAALSEKDCSELVRILTAITRQQTT